LDAIKASLRLSAEDYKKKEVRANIAAIKPALYEIVQMDAVSWKQQRETFASILEQIECCSADLKDPKEDSYEKRMIVYHTGFIEDDLKRLIRLNTPIEIPFGHLLDVMSLSLSEIEPLQKKGFFKNKIDYKTDAFYKSLDESTDGQLFKKELDAFEKKIKARVTTYVVNYDVIKEFLNKSKTKNVDDIVNELLNQSFEILKAEKESLAEGDDVKEYLTNIEQQIAEISEIPLGLITNQLSLTSNSSNKDIWDVYQMKASLNQINKKISNQTLKNKTKITLLQKMVPIASLPKISLEPINTLTDSLQVKSYNRLLLIAQNINTDIDSFNNNNGGMEEFTAIYEKIEKFESTVKDAKLSNVKMNTADFKGCNCFDIADELIVFKNAVNELSKSLPDLKSIAIKNKKALENKIQENYKNIGESDLIFFKAARTAGDHQSEVFQKIFFQYRKTRQFNHQEGIDHLPRNV